MWFYLLEAFQNVRNFVKLPEAVFLYLLWGCDLSKELYALYSSPNIIQAIKSRRLRWAGHVARMGERRSAYRALVGKPEGRRPLGRPRHRWGIILKWIFERLGVGVQTGLIWLRIGTGGGLLCIRW
jgi:hypothetical protein